MMERDDELTRQSKHAGKPLWKKTIDEARDINEDKKYMKKLKDTVELQKKAQSGDKNAARDLLATMLAQNKRKR